MSEYLLPIAVILILIALNGLFVAAEFAIVVAPLSRVANLAAGGMAAAKRVLPWLQDPRKRNRYIGTAQVGITIASLGLGMYGEASVIDWLLHPLEETFHLDEASAHTIAFIIGVGILTYLHVVLGEMVPKSIAIQAGDASLLWLSGFMSVIQKVFAPVVAGLNAVADFITRLMGIPPATGDERLFSAEELEFIVEESATGGLLDASEQVYVENIFDLQERTVAQLMTPRRKMIGIPATANLTEVKAVLCAERHSRYPVYEESLDNIVGVVHVKAVARQAIVEDGEGDFDLRQIMRPPLFIPETLKVSDMLRSLPKRRDHLAIVIDEYGGIAGLVTIEDLLEEVVGEIQDEYDEETPPMRELEPGLIEVRGDVILDELNQHYDLDLESREADTVGGLIMAGLGRLPRAGDEVLVQDVRLVVKTTEGMAVQSVWMYLPGEKP
ncbi:MAG: HlyC/CorC family transporter [Caldilineales bacterium]|nr:HlyC/CorC family transporter [Caldilineales bacterium]